MRTNDTWCVARVRRYRPSGLSSGSWDRCISLLPGFALRVGIFCSPFAVHLASFVVTPVRRLSRSSGCHGPLRQTQTAHLAPSLARIWRRARTW
eukprot:scaffold50346_cov55-Phaeocystis_antarctica.AAC.3